VVEQICEARSAEIGLYCSRGAELLSSPDMRDDGLLSAREAKGNVRVLSKSNMTRW
jgi:hypothetical protein